MTPSDEPHLPAPWGRHPLPDDGPLALELGPLVVWARRREGEVRLAHAPGDWTRAGRHRPGGPTAGPEDRDWVRWPVPEATSELGLAPVFPPRTLVIEPEVSFRLLPRGRARIFVRVPLWARFTVHGDEHGGEDRTLTEVPSVTLSDTWWGSTTEGELCYWLATTARRRVEPDVFEPHAAVCPLELANRSDDELPVERIALRVAHLSLFSEEGRLWADVTRVRYRGADEGSAIEVSGEPPREAPDARRVSGPREAPPARGFHGLTFARLKSLSGLAGL